MDIQIVGIAHDSRKNMRKLAWCDMPMIADVKREIVTSYKTFMIKTPLVDKIMGHTKVSRPIIFLINNERVVVWKYKGGAIRRPSPEEIYVACNKYL